MKPRSLIFADFEASGLQFLSYPIEIGWAWAERTHVEARSILIRPTEEWQSWKTGWSEKAERLHGLSRDQLLANGHEPSEVCEILNREWRDAEVTFDTGPAAHDARWLSILYRAGSEEPRFPMAKLSSNLCILSYARVMRIPDVVILQLDGLAPRLTHRAANDAAHWAWWRLALRLVAEEGALTPGEVTDLAAAITVKFA